MNLLQKYAIDVAELRGSPQKDFAKRCHMKSWPGSSLNIFSLSAISTLKNRLNSGFLPLYGNLEKRLAKIIVLPLMFQWGLSHLVSSRTPILRSAFTRTCVEKKCCSRVVVAKGLRERRHIS